METPETLLDVTCPCCGARLRIDAAAGGVLSHEPAPRAPKVGDLADAARALREKESRRGEQFEKSFETERKRTRLLERRFNEAFEKAKQEPVGPPPKRDIDLD